jgi:hypothetical protein
MVLYRVIWRNFNVLFNKSQENVNAFGGSATFFVFLPALKMLWKKM